MRGTVGVWLFGGRPKSGGIEEEREQLRRIDRLGYGSVWMGETVGGRDAFAHSGVALAATERLTVGTGIANLWSRPAPTMQAGGRTLAEAYPDRFVLGVGVGHPFQAESVGADYRKPLTRMRNYLSQMDEEAGVNPPAVPFSRVLAAIGPKMLELSRDAADGAHPFFMPLEHTAFAREILGPGKLLVPHQTVLLEPDPERARAIARDLVRLVLTEGASSYPQAWRDFGYDLDGTPDRLIDAAVAWGDEEAIAKRVREQLDAGADQVLVSPIAPDLPGTVDQLERLACVLL
jgi:probable F420-dependent oxidoreductase